MSEKTVTQPTAPGEVTTPPTTPTGRLKPVAPHLKITAEYTGKPQPGKTFVDNNGNVRSDN